MFIVKRPELMKMLKESNNVVYSEVNEYCIDGLYIGKYLGEHDFMTKDLLENIKINDRNGMFWEELDKMKEDSNYKSEIDFDISKNFFCNIEWLRLKYLWLKQNTLFLKDKRHLFLLHNRFLK